MPDRPLLSISTIFALPFPLCDDLLAIRRWTCTSLLALIGVSGEIPPPCKAQ